MSSASSGWRTVSYSGRMTSRRGDHPMADPDDGEDEEEEADAAPPRRPRRVSVYGIRRRHMEGPV